MLYWLYEFILISELDQLQLSRTLHFLNIRVSKFYWLGCHCPHLINYGVHILLIMLFTRCPHFIDQGVYILLIMVSTSYWLGCPHFIDQGVYILFIHLAVYQADINYEDKNPQNTKLKLKKTFLSILLTFVLLHQF